MAGKGRRIAIVGSRGWADVEAIREFIDSLHASTVVISGGARGVDIMAIELAYGRGLKTEVYRADWDAYGPSAGYIRNKVLVEKCDEVVAFWDGKSKGTKHTIDIARAAGKKVTVNTCG